MWHSQTNNICTLAQCNKLKAICACSLVPTADVRDISSLHADIRAIIQPHLPAFTVCRILAADGTLPAVEMRGAAESPQANTEFKVQVPGKSCMPHLTPYPLHPTPYILHPTPY